VSEFRADSVTDWAAALTYYGVLSIFPALATSASVVREPGDGVCEDVLGG
jgi:membrane protein